MPSATSLGFPFLTTSDGPDLAGGLQALAAAIDTWLTGPAWQSLSLAAGVAEADNSGTTNGSYHAQWRKWTNGLVEMRGAVKLSAGGTFASSATLFSAPSGTTPAGICRFAALGTVGTSVTENARIEVTPTDGLFRVYCGPSDYAFLSLDSIRYYVT